MTSRRIPDGDRALFLRSCAMQRALIAKGYAIIVGFNGEVQLRTLAHGTVATASVPGLSGGYR